MNDFIFDVNFPFYDLAAEANSALRGESDTEIPGVIEEIAEKDHCRISKITIVDDIGAAAMKRPKGNYITVEADTPEDKITQKAIIETLRDILIPMLPHNTESPILLCGIGNPDIASDALGEETISRIIPTRHLENDTSHEIGEMRPVALFAPNVLGNTGMEAAELVQAVTKQISPCAVIVIDALATASWERLGTSFQITDTGLAPGGGIGNTRPAINETACGVPVIALGVPTVIYPHAIITEIPHPYERKGTRSYLFR